jgi:hypothetical protein
VARAFLDRDHLRAASGVPSENAEHAVTTARYEAAVAALADGFTTVDGTPVPGTCTVRDATGRSRLYLHYRDPQAPVVEVFGADGEALGLAHLGVQFPMLAGEVGR